nr:MAG TPA: hypothetical protein [Caudoviricetes sp.]
MSLECLSIEFVKKFITTLSKIYKISSLKLLTIIVYN